MLTRGRISLMIAAGGLLLVGLLAAVLFAPSGNDEAEVSATPKKKKDEKPVKLEAAVVNPPASLPALMGAPTVKPDTGPAAPAVNAKPDVVKETKPAVIDYKVQSGDMLAKIAKKHGCKVEDIYKLNDGLNAQTANKIRVGQIIKVPNGPGAVDAGSTVEKTTGFPKRVIKAEPGDTAFSLAIEYYGARSMFRIIMDANPTLPWSDRLKGGEEVVLPEYGDQPSKVETKPEPTRETAGTTVERDSLIPPRR